MLLSTELLVELGSHQLNVPSAAPDGARPGATGVAGHRMVVDWWLMLPIVFQVVDLLVVDGS